MEKPASGAGNGIHWVFVWDEETKTLYSCQVQGLFLENCRPGISFDPSGYVVRGQGWGNPAANSRLNDIVRELSNQTDKRLGTCSTDEERGALQRIQNALVDGQGPVIDWLKRLPDPDDERKLLPLWARGYTYSENDIKISDDFGGLPGDRFKETLLHELFHATNRNPFPDGHPYGYPNKKKHSPFDSYSKPYGAMDSLYMFIGAEPNYLEPQHMRFADKFTDWFFAP